MAKLNLEQLMRREKTTPADSSSMVDLNATSSPVESDESNTDELAEPPMEESTELEEGTEEQITEPSTEVPEQYQTEANDLVFRSNASELAYLMSQIKARQKELSNSMTPAEKSSEFDVEGLPE